MSDTMMFEDISNYYGTLSVWKEGNSYWWAIENYDGWFPVRIPEYLYEALSRHYEEKED